MSFDAVSAIVNGILLVILFIILIIMLNLGSRFQYAYGMPIQERLKWRIMQLLLALIAIGLVAIVFNIVWPLVAPLLFST